VEESASGKVAELAQIGLVDSVQGAQMHLPEVETDPVVAGRAEPDLQQFRGGRVAKGHL
jgi:hypothetical protein